MTDKDNVARVSVHTFRFHSGQTVTLDEHQVEKIPYIAALVSAGEHYEFICDEDGCYKLDPLIDFQYFSFVLEFISFLDIRQLFTQLPKDNERLAIIDLLGFLGLISHPDPTLHEIDTTFFSTLVYSPLLEGYVHNIRRPVIQNMAVQFAIGIARGHYDLTKSEVIDQVYWFIMFILSAYELFGPRLRHHVYQIAEHYFSIFEPSLLRPLNQLMKTTQKRLNQNISIRADMDSSESEEIDELPDVENTASIQHLLYQHPRQNRWSLIWNLPTLQNRQSLLLHRTYQDPRRVWYRYEVPSESSLLEPVHKRVLEILYESLQHEVCQRAATHKSVYLRKAVKNAYYANILHSISDWETGSDTEYTGTSNYRSIIVYTVGRELGHELLDLKNDERLRKNIRRCILEDIFNRESVTKEIREYIQEELDVLASKLERKYRELVRDIARTASSLEILNNDPWFHLSVWPNYPTFEQKQEEALCYEQLLDKIRCDTIIRWQITQIQIERLCEQLSPADKSETNLLATSRFKHNYRSMPKNKPLPKFRTKCSKHH